MRYPSERMDERLGEDAWTRKQMLEHVAAWHDLTADRMIKFINTGESAPLDRDTDRFNAGVARQAIGKTSGEVLKDTGCNVQPAAPPDGAPERRAARARTIGGRRGSSVATHTATTRSTGPTSCTPEPAARNGRAALTILRADD